jgi:Omp85 superfamily domain
MHPNLGAPRAARAAHRPLGPIAIFALAVISSGAPSGAAADDSTPQPAAPEVESVYDPYRGMDADGRIPEVEKASLVDHPERWRYIPEGRIKPGNPFQRFLVSSFALPIFFQNADVGTGLGIALTDIDFRQQRRREFLGGFFSYTTEGQQSYVLRWRRWLKHVEVPGGGVLQEERSFLSAGGGYRKTLTRRFFGIGPSTNEDDETSYSDEVGFLDLGLSHSLPGKLDDLVGELSLRGEGHWLDHGRVGGRPSMESPSAPDDFRFLFEEAEEVALGWLGAGLRYDTRDSQRNPYRGTAIGGAIDAALAQTDGDIGAIYTVFADQIFPIWSLFHDGGTKDEENPPTDTLGFHFESRLSSGDLPFFARPTLGGSENQRGFIEGRWRDDAVWTAAAEYRFWVLPRGFTVWRHIRVERVGAALFYEVGGVGENGSALFHESVIQSYGVSGRVMIERAALFRADFGFSNEGFNFSAGFGLSF